MGELGTHVYCKADMFVLVFIFNFVCVSLAHPEEKTSWLTTQDRYAPSQGVISGGSKLGCSLRMAGTELANKSQLEIREHLSFLEKTSKNK